MPPSWSDQLAFPPTGRRNSKGLHPDQPEPLPWGRTLCDVPGCYAEPSSNGMCPRHFRENRSKHATAPKNSFSY